MLISTRTHDHFYIFTDSFSAVQALKNILELLGSLFNKAFRISLVWIPAHAGIIGKDRANILAKRGAAEGEFYHRPILAHGTLAKNMGCR